MQADLIEVGRLRGAYGVHGWVRVVPHQEGQALLHARRWWLATPEGDQPVDIDSARAMIARLAGREHEVMTAVVLRWQEQVEVALSVSIVTMRKLSSGEIERYIATGEPFDKAGAYAIQGRAARFIPRIRGSYSNVVGLPVTVVTKLVGQIARLAGRAADLASSR